MKKLLAILCVSSMIAGLGAGSAYAGKPASCKDTDGDGYGSPGSSVCANGSATDCNNSNASVYPGAPEICGDGIDQDCNGSDLACAGCADADGDGYNAYNAATCPSGNDCNDGNNSVNPGATEACNGIDDNCVNGVDEGGVCGTNPHAGITGTFATPKDITAKCLECHSGGSGPNQGTNVANAVASSLHGMMPTPTPNVTNITYDSQKLFEVNTFCSYPNPDMAGAACLGCHPTLGKWENLSASDIDCLRCHNDAYKMKYVAEPDSANHITVTDWQGTTKTYIPSDKDASGNFHIQFNWTAMPGLTPTDLIAGVHLPTTTTCLSCHAKAGGGDWTKRGDIGLNSASATAAQDIHLASVANGGAGLSCTSCHTPTNHEIPGRGIDLRPSEGGSVKECVECHVGMDNGGHAASGRRSEPDRHVKRVACKSCHIPAFGKGGATELWRNWQNPHWNAALCNGQGAWAGEEHKVANVAPDHVWFNGTSYIYALGQTLSKVDPISGYDMLADANGDVNDPLGTKLVPIKRHQSNMAYITDGAHKDKVIPYDVVWQFMTGKSQEAAIRGRDFNGLSGTIGWKWLEAEMGINHGVSPATNVAACSSCHHATRYLEIGGTPSKLDTLGYALKDANKDGVVTLADKAIICSQCHQEKDLSRKTWESMHTHTQKGSGIGCTFCHEIKRPERGLCEPCNPDGTENTACINEFVDTNYFDHCPN